TKAFSLPDDVPEALKKARNNELLAIQSAISLEDGQSRIGKIEEVLVEGPSKLADPDESSPVVQMTGRTQADRIVVFPGNLRQIGQLLPVRIQEATPFTLMGELITHELIAVG